MVLHLVLLLKKMSDEPPGKRQKIDEPEDTGLYTCQFCNLSFQNDSNRKRHEKKPICRPEGDPQLPSIPFNVVDCDVGSTSGSS